MSDMVSISQLLYYQGLLSGPQLSLLQTQTDTPPRLSSVSWKLYKRALNEYKRRTSCGFWKVAKVVIPPSNLSSGLIFIIPVENLSLLHRIDVRPVFSLQYIFQGNVSKKWYISQSEFLHKHVRVLEMNFLEGEAVKYEVRIKIAYIRWKGVVKVIMTEWKKGRERIPRLTFLLE